MAPHEQLRECDMYSVWSVWVQTELYCHVSMKQYAKDNTVEPTLYQVICVQAIQLKISKMCLFVLTMI